MIKSKRNILTEEDREKILNLFYRTELREGEITIKNDSNTIANELGFAIHSVSNVISSDLCNKFSRNDCR